MIRTDRQVSHEGADLLARARRAGIEGSLRLLLEPLSDGQLARLYGRMDAYLNLSEWEGFCLPVAEAMACGVPVVRPPIQGPGELVPYPELEVKARAVRREGGAELLEADPSAAAAALLEAARSPGLRARLAAAGRREAARRYGMRRVARLWARLLAGRAPGPRAAGSRRLSRRASARLQHRLGLDPAELHVPFDLLDQQPLDLPQMGGEEDLAQRQPFALHVPAQQPAHFAGKGPAQQVHLSTRLSLPRMIPRRLLGPGETRKNRMRRAAPARPLSCKARAAGPARYGWQWM